MTNVQDLFSYSLFHCMDFYPTPALWDRDQS